MSKLAGSQGASTSNVPQSYPAATIVKPSQNEISTEDREWENYNATKLLVRNKALRPLTDSLSQTLSNARDLVPGLPETTLYETTWAGWNEGIERTLDDLASMCIELADDPSLKPDQMEKSKKTNEVGRSIVEHKEAISQMVELLKGGSNQTLHSINQQTANPYQPFGFLQRTSLRCDMESRAPVTESAVVSKKWDASVKIYKQQLRAKGLPDGSNTKATLRSWF